MCHRKINILHYSQKNELSSNYWTWCLGLMSLQARNKLSGQKAIKKRASPYLYQELYYYTIMRCRNSEKNECNQNGDKEKIRMVLIVFQHQLIYNFARPLHVKLVYY